MRVEFRDVERTARNAKPAADAVLLPKINNAVHVLDDGAVGRTRPQAAGIRAVHALVFAHQPHQIAALGLMLVELDQIPIVPFCGGHCLIGVVEGRLAEGIVVPFDTGHLAGFASDTGRHVYQLGDLEAALSALARNCSGVG